MAQINPDERTARRAQRHHGILTRADALACGLTDRQIRTRLRRGQWESLGPGVYRVAGAPVTPAAQIYAGVLLAGAGAVASSLSSLSLYGVAAPPTVPTVCVPPDGSARTAGVRIRRSPIEPIDRTLVGPIPTTTAARALLEAAPLVSASRLANLLDDVLDHRLATPSSVVGVIRRSQTGKGRPGVQKLRDALDPWLDGIMPGSPAEVRLLRKLTDAGLPRPVKQHRVRLPSGKEVRLDLAWPDRLAAIEYDGARWHGPRRLGADVAREEQLRALGWWVERADRADLAPSSTRVVDLVRSRLLQRSVA